MMVKNKKNTLNKFFKISDVLGTCAKKSHHTFVMRTIQDGMYNRRYLHCNGKKNFKKLLGFRNRV